MIVVFIFSMRGRYPAMATSSLAPPEVPMELHAGNRDRLLTALRARLSATASPPRGLALLQVPLAVFIMNQSLLCLGLWGFLYQHFGFSF